MDELFDVLKFVLPAGIVFLTAFYLLKEFLRNEQHKRNLEYRSKVTSSVVPLRLQAYERVVLFLERISTENVIMRLHKSGMSGNDLHALILSTVRHEYEHNISQQIYMSEECWNRVKNAKEETIRIVNIASSKVSDEASGLELSKAVFKVASELKKLPTTEAIEFIKKEIRKNF